MNESTYWQALEAVGTWAAVIIGILTYCIVRRELRALHVSQSAQAYDQITARLQADDVRAARRRVFTLLKNCPLKDWTEVDRLAAEKAGQTYNQVATMILNEMVDGDVFMERWGHSLVETWKIVAPMVNERARTEGNPILWEDLKRLADRVEARKVAPRLTSLDRGAREVLKGMLSLLTELKLRAPNTIDALRRGLGYKSPTPSARGQGGVNADGSSESPSRGP